MIVEPSGAACGATVRGVDLSRELSADDIAKIRKVWLEHKVLAFADQSMDDDALERFTLAMGEFGEDPFFDPIEGRKNIAAILREADETSPLFADNWHSDWSFLPNPPSATCLMAVEIPLWVVTRFSAIRQLLLLLFPKRGSGNCAKSLQSIRQDADMRLTACMATMTKGEAWPFDLAKRLWQRRRILWSSLILKPGRTCSSSPLATQLALKALMTRKP